MFDGSTLHRVERLAHQGQCFLTNGRRFTIQRLSTTINHTAQQCGAQGHLRGTVQNAHHVPRAHPHRIGEGHQKEGLVVKAHHFSFYSVTVLADHLAASTHRRHDAARFERQAHQAHQCARSLRGRYTQMRQALFDHLTKIQHLHSTWIMRLRVTATRSRSWSTIMRTTISLSS